MIKIFELYLRGCNKVIQYLHDWYNYIQDCEIYQNDVLMMFLNTWCPQNKPCSATNLRYELGWSVIMSLTLNCYTHRREWYLKPSNINIVTSCGRDKFSYRTVYWFMIFHIFDIACEFFVCARFRTILIAIGIIESVKLNGQALLIVFKIQLWRTNIVMKTLLSVRTEIAHFCSITWNDLWRNFNYF